MGVGVRTALLAFTQLSSVTEGFKLCWSTGQMLTMKPSFFEARIGHAWSDILNSFSLLVPCVYIFIFPNTYSTCTYLQIKFYYKKKGKKKKKLRRETFNLHKAWLETSRSQSPPGPTRQTCAYKRTMTTTRVVVFLLGLLACSSRAEIPGLTNRWAVEVRGGPEAANILARKYGFENRGQVRYSGIWFSLFSSRSVH